ncbi:MAG: SpoIIE family protein phosphatase [Pseudomonadota bacterium]
MTPVSYRSRLLGGLLLLSLGLAGAAAVLLFLAFEENEREEAQAWMQATVVQVAARIDPAWLASPAGRETLTGYLREAREALVREVDSALGQPLVERTIADLVVLVPEDRGATGRVIASLRENQVGLRHDMALPGKRSLGWRELSVEDSPSSDASGAFVRAYVPIRDSNGTPVAALRMDAAPGYFDELWLEAAIAALLVFLVTSLVSYGLTRRLSGQLARPVEAVVAGMDAVARGELDVKLTLPATMDELDALTRHFNRMVVDLRDRERMKRGVDAAAEVQRHLLPVACPGLRGYDIHGGARYCDEAGGDYFDFFRLAEGQPGERLALIIADVAGHGLGASLVMTSVRAMLQQGVRMQQESIFDVLQRVNRQLLHDRRTGTFVTAFAATIDPACHRFEWLSAGHDPGLLLRATGAVERLDATGIPLGVLESDIPPGEAFDLAPGDLLVVGTDGLSQVRNPAGEPLGLERIAALLRADGQCSAEDTWEAVMGLARAHQETDLQEDDMTLMVVRREN